MSRGHEVYAITARPDINGDPLRDYLEEQLGIPRDHVFFEPGGKAGRIHSLGLDAYYGDSDSDITEAAKAHVRGIRFLRSPRSSNRQSGRLAKYHPGYFGEPIIANSYE
jgi:acid phosphatase class B